MKVVLYTTHCPRCMVLEKKLDAKNIQYDKVEDVNVMIDKGYMSAPVLEVDGVSLEFGKANDWINAQ